jgi:molybdate transport system ATP-binding protein
MMADALHIQLELDRPAFHLNVDLHLPSAGITVVFGASGSGKTTLLRCVAGLERARKGRIELGTNVWQDEQRSVFLPVWRRPLGYVFQEASLFDHLSVRRNLEFGMRRTRSDDAGRVLNEAIELLGLQNLLARQPGQLSGGERQRVAIARALATQPQLLLLDEPLASLDTERRQDILPWLERLHDQLAIPMVYVTHATDELSRLADHVVVLEQGQAKVQGPLNQVLTQGNLPGLAEDEAGAVIPGTVTERDTQWHLARIDISGGHLLLRDTGAPCGHPVRLRILARDVSLSLDEPVNSSIQNHVQARIDAILPGSHPSQVMVRLLCNDQTLLARITRKSVAELGLHTGQRVWAQVKSVAVVT